MHGKVRNYVQSIFPVYVCLTLILCYIAAVFGTEREAIFMLLTCNVVNAAAATLLKARITAMEEANLSCRKSISVLREQLYMYKRDSHK